MNGLTPMRKVAFYIRVSTERQARVEEGSLKNQEQMLRSELERRNAQRERWGAFAESYVDEGFSGKATNRPALQRLMADIEMGKINTVMFTELSRLSRSLRDFLSIFELVQRYGCDLVCLKTEIDTTSPYKGLVTKILMVFSEFEREMTSHRTAISAYERSKRGLANGGHVLLGYRRDKKHKGYLLVEAAGAEVVRGIFRTYVREKSIRTVTELIKARYGGYIPRLRRITPKTTYGVLTNKAYLGIRVIQKRNKANYEEVKAVWEPILDEKLFCKAQAILQSNKDRFHRRGDQRYQYVLSGLLSCAKCGEQLHGKSAYSSSGKRHNYYAHRATCAKGGVSRVGAEMIEGLVLDWLRDISANSMRFQDMLRRGRDRIRTEIEGLRKEAEMLGGTQSEQKQQIEARIQELTRSRAGTVRESIENSIAGLEQERRKVEERQTLIDHSVSELEELISAKISPYARYRKHINEVLDSTNDQRRMGLRTKIAALSLQERSIKIALANECAKVPCHPESVLFARNKANGMDLLPALVEGTITLPALGFRNQSLVALRQSVWLERDRERY